MTGSVFDLLFRRAFDLLTQPPDPGRLSVESVPVSFC